MKNEMILAVDLARGPDQTGYAVVMYDHETGESKFWKTTRTKAQALNSMRELHQDTNLPYRFSFTKGPDGIVSIDKIDEFPTFPRNALELLNWCRR